MNVLLAHEDSELGAVASVLVGRRDIRLQHASSVRDAIRKIESGSIDAVAADADLSDGGGLVLLKWLRAGSDTPLIVLSDRHDERQMEAVFDAGADDYLAQPYSPKEFLLRLQAVSRRRMRPSTAEVIEFAGLRIDRDAWTVSYLGTALRLTRIEQRILYCLAAHAGHVTPTGRLVGFAWRDQGGDTNVLKTHISHVRRKLAAVGARVSITATPGIGYLFDVASDTSDSRAVPPTLQLVSAVS